MNNTVSRFLYISRVVLFILCLLFFYILYINQSQALNTKVDGWQFGSNQTRDVTIYDDTCRRITNSPVSRFIPTRSATEWNNFTSYASFIGVSVNYCPVNCVGSWSSYGSCSLSCGSGTQTRTFTQTVAAQYGGASCTSLYGAENGGTQNQSCNTFSCTQVGTCGGSIVASASASTAGTFTQTWNGSIYAPATLNWSYGAGTCGYTCNANYTWNGSSCVANTQTYTCPAKPATGTSWNSVASYTQTWNGSAWSPANTSTVYNATSSTTACNYKCATNYTWNGSSCAPDTQNVSCGTLPVNTTASTSTTYTQTWNGSAWAPTYSWAPGAGTCGYTYNTQTYTCPAKPATGTLWNSVASYTQTWNGSAWSPANTSTVYNATSSTTACNYVCAVNYTWNGSSCAPDTRLDNCLNGNIPNATATTPSTYTQTWNGSAWAPTISWSYGALTCGYACNTNYSWNGSSCVGIPPTASMWASPTTITGGNGTNLYWSSTNADWCERTGVISVPYGTWPSGQGIGTVGGLYTNPLTNNPTTFYLHCHGPGGDAYASTTVSIVPINGVCGAAEFTCNSGIAVSDTIDLSCLGPHLWHCSGTYGGTNANCSATNYAANKTIGFCSWTLVDSVSPGLCGGGGGSAPFCGSGSCPSPGSQTYNTQYCNKLWQ